MTEKFNFKIRVNKWINQSHVEYLLPFWIHGFNVIINKITGAQFIADLINEIVNKLFNL